MKNLIVLFSGVVLILMIASARKVDAQELRYDGVYQEKNDDYCGYLRFYKEGIVISVSSTTSNINKLIKWFNLSNPNPDIGHFEISSQRITFSVTSSTGTVDYAGTIEENRLKLHAYSHINDKSFDDEYKFVKVESTKLREVSPLPNPESIPKHIINHAQSIDKDLSNAIEMNNLKAVEKALKKSANINEKDYDGLTALMKASSNGYTTIAQFLIEKGANVNEKDKDGVTALMRAVMKGHIDIAQLLIEKGANVDEKDKNGFTALNKAGKEGHLDIAKLLIEKGANVNEKNKYGSTVMLAVAYLGHIDIATVLIERGANLNEKNISGWTALLAAIRNGHIDMARLLIEKGANIHNKTNTDSTALMLAARNGGTDITQLLIEKGANVNEKDNMGSTALMISAQKGHTEVAKLLIEKGANVNEKKEYNETALILAAKAGQPDIAQLLIDKGANVNEKTNDGFQKNKIPEQYIASWGELDNDGKIINQLLIERNSIIWKLKDYGDYFIRANQYKIKDEQKIDFSLKIDYGKDYFGSLKSKAVTEVSIKILGDKLYLEIAEIILKVTQQEVGITTTLTNTWSAEQHFYQKTKPLK